MIVLAIETAGPRGGVAVVKDGRLAARIVFETQGRLGARLTPAVDEALKIAGLEPGTPPDLIAVDIGPGSYTGTRVGLAAAKGLGFGWKTPLVGVSSLSAIAAAAPPSATKVLAAIDARKGEIYATLYERVGVEERNGTFWRPVWQPGITTPLKAAAKMEEGVVVVGDAAELVRMATPKSVSLTLLTGDESWPTPEAIATLGYALYQNGRLDDTLSLTPVYMRPTTREVNQGRKRRRTKTRAK